MKIIADMHTHTNVSAHAYSSLEEMCAGASRYGHKAIAITNHAPTMEDGAHPWHFGNYKVMPKKISGVYLLAGIEYDILENGKIYELQEKYRETIKWAIASFHEQCNESSSSEHNTNALLNILKNPNVDCLGHLGNPNFPFDMEFIISKCNEYGKIIEINNNSHSTRKGSDENCKNIAILCKKYSVPIMLNSDAHISYSIGNIDFVEKLIKSIDFPEELIINICETRFRNYILEKKGIDILAD